MALKRSYPSLEDIPEALRAHYVERDGQYVLDAEQGEGEKNAQDVERALRARDNEKAERDKIRQQLQELQAKFEGIDPDKIDDIREAQSKLEDLEHQRLIDEKKFEEAAEKKFERRTAELQRSIEASQQQLQETQAKQAAQRQKMEQVVIERSLQEEFLKSGANPEMLRYLMLDAKAKWELDPETDEPVPIDFIEGGKTKVTAVGKDGKPLTMGEHVKSMLADLPWAVLESTGGGSRHQNQGRGGQNGFVLTSTEAKDFSRYKSVREQAEKAGQEVTVVPG